MTTESGPQDALSVRVGKQLLAWRTQRGYSQHDVARATGMTQASVSNYERGKRELPLWKALAVSDALDISLGELLEVPDLIVLRDSRLGRAVSELEGRPDLLPD